MIETKNYPYNMALSPDGNMIFYEMNDPSTANVNGQMDAYLYDIARARETLIYQGGMDRRRVGYNAAWCPNSDFLALFVLDEDLMNNQKMIIKNIRTLDETIIEAPCGSVSDAVWVAAP